VIDLADDTPLVRIASRIDPCIVFPRIDRPAGFPTKILAGPNREDEPQ